MPGWFDPTNSLQLTNLEILGFPTHPVQPIWKQRASNFYGHHKPLQLDCLRAIMDRVRSTNDNTWVEKCGFFEEKSWGLTTSQILFPYITRAIDIIDQSKSDVSWRTGISPKKRLTNEMLDFLSSIPTRSSISCSPSIACHTGFANLALWEGTDLIFRNIRNQPSKLRFQSFRWSCKSKSIYIYLSKKPSCLSLPRIRSANSRTVPLVLQCKEDPTI